MSDTTLTPSRLFEALAAEMATAVASLLGETTSTTPVPPAGDTAWLARLTATGTLSGDISVGLAESDGRRISALIMGFEGDDVPDEAVVDTLREICSQAVGALTQAPETAGVKLVIDSVSRTASTVSVDDAWRFSLPGDVTPAIAVGGSLAVGSVTVGPIAVAKPASAPVASPPPAPAQATSTAGSNLDLLLDVELPLSVRFGQAELTLQHLTRLGPGSVIDLHRSADEPVEVLVSGKVIARGEVVVVEGNYGVRVTEVVSTMDRIRSLGA
jgi:flagellar motor switch protein FliN/FliY